MCDATPSDIVVTFRIGRQFYALPLESVSQVVRLPDLTEIVGATKLLAGMLNLRGTFLPIIDSHALMGLTTGYLLESSLLIIALDGNPTFGMLADEVDAVEPIPPSGVAELSNRASFVRGIMRDTTRSVILLDPDALHEVIVGVESHVLA